MTLPDGKTKCNRCGKLATKWVGLADPDAERYPKCELHADTFKIELMLHAVGLKDKDVLRLAESMVEKSEGTLK